MYKSRSGYGDDDLFRLVNDETFVGSLSITERVDLMYDYCEALERFYISNKSYSADTITEIAQLRARITNLQLSHIQQLKDEIRHNNMALANHSKKFSLGIIGGAMTAIFGVIIVIFIFVTIAFICSLIF